MEAAWQLFPTLSGSSTSPSHLKGRVLLVPLSLGGIECIGSISLGRHRKLYSYAKRFCNTILLYAKLQIHI